MVYIFSISLKKNDDARGRRIQVLNLMVWVGREEGKKHNSSDGYNVDPHLISYDSHPSIM